ncbi:MAG TPA: BadF/BadG/BcrA/BcrD ATPase family protein [Terriglobales bacterium]|jgi:N-acetylglucosamine kinase-like BadF-type ATPase|nr:BadF/BadG/BcrA/BcrD ATPase family protein [Terriglobales bacterium]
MGIFLGIDGGATKTECALGDETRVLARARAATCKIQNVGETEARAVLQQVIGQACAAASVERSAIERTCLGLSGAASPEVGKQVRELFRDLVAGEVVVQGDMRIALEAAFDSGPGLVVIAGTGSIAYGRNSRGETARAGGWGPAVSDEGSGNWIGRQAVAAVLRAHDSGESTPLAAAVLNALGASTCDELLRVVNSQPPPDFAALLPHVLRAAEGGGTHARELLTRAGSELSGLAKAVMRRLWPGWGALRVAMAGGVFRNSSLVRQAFSNSLLAERAQAEVLPEVVEPVLGALALARRPAVGARRER